MAGGGRRAWNMAYGPRIHEPKTPGERERKEWRARLGNLPRRGTTEGGTVHSEASGDGGGARVCVAWRLGGVDVGRELRI